MKKQTKRNIRNVGGVIFVVIIMLFLLGTKGQSPKIIWGANIHISTDNLTINSMRDIGLTMGRYDSLWVSDEQQRGVYEFTDDDKRINTYLSNNITPLVILGYTNPLYYPYGPEQNKILCNVSDFESKFIEFKNAYSEYAYRYALHFKGRVKYYEIINEANYLFCPDISGRYGDSNGVGALKYGEVLKETYTKIKKADPNAQIVVSGVGTWDALVKNWYLNLYLYGYNKYFDILATHPYGIENIQKLNNIEQIMVNYGDKDKEVWITETGRPSEGCEYDSSNKTVSNCPSGIYQYNSEKQTEYYQKTLDLTKNLTYVKAVFFYQLRESCGNDVRRWDVPYCADRKVISSQCPIDIECRYAIMNTNGTAKPAYYTLKEFINKSKAFK